MKTRSVGFKDVFHEKWQTPISHGQSIALMGLLQTITHVHFFFTIDAEKDCHVMTIGRHWPYRLIEEEYAFICIGKYLRETPAQKKRSKSHPRRPFRTWKFWGTSFVKELDEGHALSGYKMVRDKNQFSYFITTQDEWIEIVSNDPKWEVFRNTKVKKVMQNYLKKY